MFLSNQSYKFKKMNLQIVIKAVASKGLYHGIIIDNYKMRFNAFYIVLCFVFLQLLIQGLVQLQFQQKYQGQQA